ncbi:hypothetical protein Hanom_Chr16g01446951 [Helianthus anomalus]
MQTYEQRERAPLEDHGAYGSAKDLQELEDMVNMYFEKSGKRMKECTRKI